MTELESQLEGSIALARRIKQLERINATLAAEIDLARPIIEAAISHKRQGYGDAELWSAVTAYEAAKEQG